MPTLMSPPTRPPRFLPSSNGLFGSRLPVIREELGHVGQQLQPGSGLTPSMPRSSPNLDDQPLSVRPMTIQ